MNEDTPYVEPRHTPGPWHVDVQHEWGDFGSYIGPDLVGVKAANGEYVFRFDDDYGPEMPANARLIAASPRLLAAAKVVAYEYLSGEHTPEADELRAAIAESEGRETE